jgi:hypothetical protein
MNYKESDVREGEAPKQKKYDIPSKLNQAIEGRGDTA